MASHHLDSFSWSLFNDKLGFNAQERLKEGEKSHLTALLRPAPFHRASTEPSGMRYVSQQHIVHIYPIPASHNAGGRLQLLLFSLKMFSCQQVRFPTDRMEIKARPTGLPEEP